MKAGRKPAGTRAALTHSAAIVGADDVFDAALRRAGVVRVRSFTQLFSAAKCLASRYRPVGRKLAIVTNGGGPGVLAADWTNEIGLEVAKLDGPTRNALAPLLSPHASLSQLIDLGEEATAAHYRAAVEACGADGGPALPTTTDPTQALLNRTWRPTLSVTGAEGFPELKNAFVELFSAAKCLASRYRPVGPKLAIVTNGGGPGVLAADWINEIGLQLGRLPAERADALLPRCRPAPRWPT